MHENLDEYKFRPDTTTDSGVICPLASEKLMFNVVNTLAPSCLIGCSSFLQIIRTFLKSRLSWKFGHIRLCTAEFAATERLKKNVYLLENFSKYFMKCWLSGDRSLPIGLLVFNAKV